MSGKSNKTYSILNYALGSIRKQQKSSQKLNFSNYYSHTNTNTYIRLNTWANTNIPIDIDINTPMNININIEIIIALVLYSKGNTITYTSPKTDMKINNIRNPNQTYIIFSSTTLELINLDYQNSQ